MDPTTGTGKLLTDVLQQVQRVRVEIATLDNKINLLPVGPLRTDLEMLSGAAGEYIDDAKGQVEAILK